MINRYSLADHLVKITLPANLTVGGANIGGTVLSIGGPGNNGQTGSFVGEITVERNTDTWTTEGDPTGSWVHNKSLNRTGSVAMQLRQVSDDVVRLQMLAQVFENGDFPGCKIEVFSGTDTVARAEDCYITRIPSQVFGDSAAMQTWGWTAGRVTFPATTNWPTERT